MMERKEEIGKIMEGKMGGNENEALCSGSFITKKSIM